ncbi:agmatinase [Candidatus Margulisiibacteriota bacterium]
MPKGFLSPDPKFAKYKTSRFVVIPCPHEKTVCYGKGTKNGPKAIIDASAQVEVYDEELHHNTLKRVGIHTTKVTSPATLTKETLKVFKANKIPIILGGEHSISLHAVKAARSIYPTLSVLHFDAHADLRDTFQGKKDSHACAARRMIEICPVVHVGIRNISEEETTFADEKDQTRKIHWADKPINPQAIISQLRDTVYLSFDVDVLDPSIMPSTGTPEPGGLLWKETLDILREVCKQRRIVGADFVELAPIKGLHAPDFTIAKLIYRLIGYLSR